MTRDDFDLQNRIAKALVADAPEDYDDAASVLVPVMRAYADEQAKQALLAAADWFLADDDEGGPSYTAPDGHPYYEAEFWAASHLRARAGESR